MPAHHQRLLASLASAFGCRVETFPVKYLGSFIGLNPRRINSWDFLLSKLRSKLASWKGSLLSIGGRVALIKSALRSLPMYNMSIYRMPLKVVEKCEAIFRNFLWCGEDRRSKMCKVSWSEISKPFDNGGLGIGNLRSKNEALILKWAWQLLSGSQKLWVNIVKSRFSIRFPCDLWQCPSIKRSIIWRDIAAVWGQNSELSTTWHNTVKLVVGDGRSFSFWKDGWLAGIDLAESFPDLYAINLNQNGAISEFRSIRYWDGGWNFNWSRGLSIYEHQQLGDLISLCGSISFSNLPDKLIWSADIKGSYSVASCSATIDRSRSQLVSEERLSSCWNNKVPFKISFSCWLMLRRRLATNVFLQERNIPGIDSSCVACGLAPEDVDHLFLRCTRAQEVWYQVFRWLNLLFPLPGNITNMWDGWTEVESLFSSEGACWARLLLFATCWQIWICRNERIFNDRIANADSMFHKIMVSWFLWITSHYKSFPYSFGIFSSSSSWLYSWNRVDFNPP